MTHQHQGTPSAARALAALAFVACACTRAAPTPAGRPAAVPVGHPVAVPVPPNAPPPVVRAECEPSPSECDPVRGGILCDDCDFEEVSSRTSRPVFARCLEHALRCGPEPQEQVKWAAHGPGAVPTSTARFYLRAVVLLAALTPEGPDVLRTSRTWPLPPTARNKRDRTLGVPVPVPASRRPIPAGPSPCRALPGAADVTDAALHCFESRVKPELLQLETRVRHFHTAAWNYEEGFYRFGNGAYVRETYALRPTVQLDARPWSEVESGLRQQPAKFLQATTALGSLADVDPRREWVAVSLRLRSPQMPQDGDTLLQFVIDAETWTTVFVYRVVGG